MYALKPSKQTSIQPGRGRRMAPRAKAHKRSKPYQAIVYETTAKLAVNVVLSVAAVVTLAHLLPYRSAQEVKLQELHAAVKTTGDRVQRVQSKFTYYFDPSQARESMQELTDRIDPLRRQIIWKEPDSKPVPTQLPETAADPGQ
ncbi:slr1601 family putative cell division protein [Leptodesmis sp.]|uniref:slr1601 family putative cell division protein n=1 Tax=Leptodesmis sp. TaxID=3100501 RepID=UPI00405354C2